MEANEQALSQVHTVKLNTAYPRDPHDVRMLTVLSFSSLFTLSYALTSAESRFSHNAMQINRINRYNHSSLPEFTIYQL